MLWLLLVLISSIVLVLGILVLLRCSSFRLWVFMNFRCVGIIGCDIRCDIVVVVVLVLWYSMCSLVWLIGSGVSLRVVFMISVSVFLLFISRWVRL